MFSGLFRGPTESEIATAYFANCATRLLENLEQQQGESLAKIALGRDRVSFGELNTGLGNVAMMGIERAKSRVFGVLSEFLPIGTTYFRHKRDIAELRERNRTIQAITKRRPLGIVARALPDDSDIASFRPIAEKLRLSSISAILGHGEAT